MLWKRNVEKRTQNRQLIQERKDYQECLFEPQLFRKKNGLDRKFIEKKEVLGNDFMYNRTMEWKNKLDENIKRRELEIDEKRNKEFTRYIKNIVKLKLILIKTVS